jgi:hypothetical protein
MSAAFGLWITRVVSAVVAVLLSGFATGIGLGALGFFLGRR